MRPKRARRKTENSSSSRRSRALKFARPKTTRKPDTPKPQRSNVEAINSASRGHLNQNPRFHAPADKNAARGEISRPKQATQFGALPERRQKQRRRPNI